ncbi:MAG: hypothetical protein QG575_556 [Euryarchaeota archaeon]|nr:hypothetical protein [Euryarchaeota archaeon]
MQNRMILLLSVMISLAAIGVAVAASQDFITEDFITDNLSYNNSSISLIGENKITRAPVDLTPGSGYYSSHPIAIGTAIGSRTELSNDNSATSMSHEVGFAQEVSGKREYKATSRSMHSEYKSIDLSTTQMQIDETVTSGKVQIGVLSGSDGSAWKNPAIEIEEEYVGTYHITKNFAINNSYTKRSFADGWLNCCGGSYDFYDIYLPKPVLVSADDVFNCRRCNSHISLNLAKSR